MIDNFKKIWKDPVGSKIISAGILFLITLIYNKFQSYTEDVTFKDAFTTFWNYSIKLWIIVSVILASIIIFSFYSSIKKNKKYKYDEDTKELDTNLYIKIRDELLTDDMMMNVKQNVFSSNSFYGETLFKILDIIDESRKSYFEFLNPILESKKNDLIETISELHNITSVNVSGVHGTAGWLSIPREWAHNDRERFDNAWKSISLLENELAEKYDDFIKTGKRILKI